MWVMQTVWVIQVVWIMWRTFFWCSNRQAHHQEHHRADNGAHQITLPPSMAGDKSAGGVV